MARWLDNSAAPAILRQLNSANQLTHEDLDELPAGKPVEHLRSILVAVETLPPRDEQMARLERWITATIAERPDPDEAHLLRRYALWHILRRLRRRLNGSTATHNQLVNARQHVKAAVSLLDWLTANNLTLATAGQGDLDNWLTSDTATLRREAGHFVRWAKKQKLTSLDFPASRWGGPSGIIDTEARWKQARRLLHDDTIKPDDRVAGLLVLLYAQWPATISRLTLDHVDTTGDQVRIRLGREPVVLPEPLGGLVLQLAATREVTPASATKAPPAGCSPAGNPGSPSAPTSSPNASASSDSAPARPDPPHSSNSPPTCPPRSSPACSASTSASLSHGNAPSNGDWTNYAADVSRRAEAMRQAFRQFQYPTSPENGVKVVPSYLLQPVVVYKDNYQKVLVDSGYYTANQLQ